MEIRTSVKEIAINHSPPATISPLSIGLQGVSVILSVACVEMTPYTSHTAKVDFCSRGPTIPTIPEHFFALPLILAIDSPSDTWVITWITNTCIYLFLWDSLRTHSKQSIRCACPSHGSSRICLWIREQKIRNWKWKSLFLLQYTLYIIGPFYIEPSLVDRRTQKPSGNHFIEIQTRILGVTLVPLRVRLENHEVPSKEHN